MIGLATIHQVFVSLTAKAGGCEYNSGSTTAHDDVAWLSAALWTKVWRFCASPSGGREFGFVLPETVALNTPVY